MSQVTDLVGRAGEAMLEIMYRAAAKLSDRNKARGVFKVIMKVLSKGPAPSSRAPPPPPPIVITYKCASLHMPNVHINPQTKVLSKVAFAWNDETLPDNQRIHHALMDSTMAVLTGLHAEVPTWPSTLALAFVQRALCLKPLSIPR